jgi:hypothetical protein
VHAAEDAGIHRLIVFPMVAAEKLEATVRDLGARVVQRVTAVQVAVWVHPVAALATNALVLYGVSLALKGRRLGRRGGPFLLRHRRLMPWVLALVVANFVGGLVSAWLWRDPEDLAASGHYTVGSRGRAVRGDRRARVADRPVATRPRDPPVGGRRGAARVGRADLSGPPDRAAALTLAPYRPTH